ncbi:hypothetical protein KIN20_032636 [Parelaphostrongylus tenuis]|uniref:Uncharacterized protein n=1 Tax=Parelaphostrongylus tenuis TaxID=148309 RepID=A0AAD5R737_PARTN|nr:hypothetical protein KIN20_032636 [Parelaphostrongylus tenuis]
MLESDHHNRRKIARERKERIFGGACTTSEKGPIAACVLLQFRSSAVVKSTDVEDLDMLH